MNASRYVLTFLTVVAFFATTGRTSLVYAQSPTVPEYSVKAAFIYNFAKFVEWPDQTSGDPKTPLVLCVIGRGPARNAFSELKNRAVKGKELDIQYNDEIFSLRQCNIIYISSSDAGRTADILDAVRGESVLTIGESPEFIRSGGIINFTFVDKKIRFQINLPAAVRARLSISSQLLKLADIREER
jgi:hypothetical protein